MSRGEIPSGHVDLALTLVPSLLYSLPSKTRKETGSKIHLWVWHPADLIQATRGVCHVSKIYICLDTHLDICACRDEILLTRLL